MLTLDRVANYEPVRVVDAPRPTSGRPAPSRTVLGWGRIARGRQHRARTCRKVDVPIADDSRCATAYGAAYKPAVMLCAADPLGTAPRRHRDPCEGDAGGPLLVPDGGFFALAGIFSAARPARPPRTRASSRASATTRSTRWVHERDARGRLRLRATQPRASEPVTLTLDLAPPRGRRATSRRSGGTSTTTAPSTTRRPARSRTTSRPPGAGGRRPRGLAGPAATRRRSTTRSTSSPAPDGPAATHDPGSCRPSRRRPRSRPARHDPRRQAPEGEPRPLRDPRPLRQDGADAAPP